LVVCPRLVSVCLRIVRRACRPSYRAKAAARRRFSRAAFRHETAAGFGGFAIDLWSKIATTLGWTCDYQQISSIPELLDKLNKGELDVGVTDLSVTSERLKLVDFTQPYLDAGLQVMINEKYRGGFAELVRGSSEAGHLQVFVGGALLLLFATIFLTLYDRRLDPAFHRSWTMGLSESFYHVVSMATAGKADHRPIISGAVGNFVAALWLICGVTMIAYITSSITSDRQSGVRSQGQLAQWDAHRNHLQHSAQWLDDGYRFRSNRLWHLLGNRTAAASDRSLYARVPFGPSRRQPEL
jgi:Bacterial extracellular solute-binding proteins, family 3